jgi:hypothetical protein
MVRRRPSDHSLSKRQDEIASLKFSNAMLGWSDGLRLTISNLRNAIFPFATRLICFRNDKDNLC